MRDRATVSSAAAPSRAAAGAKACALREPRARRVRGTATRAAAAPCGASGIDQRWSGGPVG
jgi:hypothetical protein